MHKSTPSPRWFAGWLGGARSASRNDPADQGTAFGLEMSLLPFDADVIPAPPAPPPRRGGWMQRWTERRKPA